MSETHQDKNIKPLKRYIAPSGAQPWIIYSLTLVCALLTYPMLLQQGYKTLNDAYKEENVLNEVLDNRLPKEPSLVTTDLSNQEQSPAVLELQTWLLDLALIESSFKDLELEKATLGNTNGDSTSNTNQIAIPFKFDWLKNYVKTAYANESLTEKNTIDLIIEIICILNKNEGVDCNTTNLKNDLSAALTNFPSTPLGNKLSSSAELFLNDLLELHEPGCIGKLQKDCSNTSSNIPLLNIFRYFLRFSPQEPIASDALLKQVLRKQGILIENIINKDILAPSALTEEQAIFAVDFMSRVLSELNGAKKVRDARRNLALILGLEQFAMILLAWLALWTLIIRFYNLLPEFSFRHRVLESYGEYVDLIRDIRLSTFSKEYVFENPYEKENTLKELESNSKLRDIPFPFNWFAATPGFVDLPLHTPRRRWQLSRGLLGHLLLSKAHVMYRNYFDRERHFDENQWYLQNTSLPLNIKSTSKPEDYLKENTKSVTEQSENKSNGISQKTSPTSPIPRNEQELRKRFKLSAPENLHEKGPFLAEFHAICEAEKEKIFNNRLSIRLVMILLPAIGFIGTVRGIMGALAQADTIVAALTQQAQQEAVTFVASTLALAFATTFFALLFNLILKPLSDYEERLSIGVIDKMQSFVSACYDGTFIDRETQAKVYLEKEVDSVPRGLLNLSELMFRNMSLINLLGLLYLVILIAIFVGFSTFSFPSTIPLLVVVVAPIIVPLLIFSRRNYPADPVS